VFGSMPITAITETTIAKWVKQLGGSGRPSQTGTASCPARSMPQCVPGSSRPTRARGDACRIPASKRRCS
jgi:hypothetical protein